MLAFLLLLTIVAAMSYAALLDNAEPWQIVKKLTEERMDRPTTF